MGKNKKNTIVIKSSDKTPWELSNNKMNPDSDRDIRFIDEDGYELTHPDDIKDFLRGFRKRKKEQWLETQKATNYNLSRWGQEVVNILQENGQMKNVDIMVELQKRGHNGSQTNISKFFTSKDGQRFRKEQLINSFEGYWSLRNK